MAAAAAASVYSCGWAMVLLSDWTERQSHAAQQACWLQLAAAVPAAGVLLVVQQQLLACQHAEPADPLDVLLPCLRHAQMPAQ